MSKKTEETRETVVQFLRVPLSQEEFDDRATQLAQALSEKQAAEAKLASVRSSFRASIDEIQTRIEKFQQQVQEHAEWRDVECEKVYDFKGRQVYFVNNETGECFGQRNMRPDEMQTEMQFTDPHDNDPTGE